MNTTLSNLSAQQLRRAADLKERIESLTHELERLLGGPFHGSAAASKRWHVSPARVAGIGAAARKRGAKPRRKLSAAAKARLAAIARERWKKAKAAGRSKL